MISGENIESLISQRIGVATISRVIQWVGESESHRMKLWELARSADRRVAVNALWIMTRLPEEYAGWLSSLRDPMIAMLLGAKDVTVRRNLLRLLREMDFAAADVRGDLLDYCMAMIPAESEPYAIRCFSLYVAFKMCRHFPELLGELELLMDMISTHPLSPGLKSALRQTRQKIRRTTDMN